MNLPNKLTILRIALVPIMVIIPFLGIGGEILGIPTFWILVDLVFIIGAITDKLDGNLARKNNQVTTLGKFLDPIADKILVLSALIILVEFQKLPSWVPIIVLLREFIVSGYRLIAVEKGGKVIAASFWGKLKTVTQMTAIIMMFLDKFNFFEFLTAEARAAMQWYEITFNVLTSVVMLISVIATVFSGWSYLKNGKNLLKDK